MNAENPTSYEDMSREELKREAVRLGVDLVKMGGKTDNEDIIAALRAKAATAPTSDVGDPVSDEDAALLEEAELASLPDFSSMNRKEVLEMAESYGMAVKSNTTKGEGEDYILAALGVTENEQAAQGNAARDEEGV